MKFSIEIEDIADKDACVLAIRQLFAALEAQYGEDEAQRIWRDNNSDFRTPWWRAREKMQCALQGVEYAHQRLIFEYYAMEAPSKQGLAKVLASKNVALHKEWREWKAAQNRWADENREDLLRQDELVALYHKTGQRSAFPSIPEPPRHPSGFFARGTTDRQTMLQQIKRVFRKHPEACAAVGEAPTEMREEARWRLEAFCRMDIELEIIMGHRPKRIFSRGTKRKR